MTLRHLKIFMAVYETLSFTKAGQKLFLAQPSVSLAIKELEEYYGVLLFDRIKHSIYPTEYGEKLYGYVSHIYSLLDEMNKSVKDPYAKSTIKIGSSITIANSILPHIIHIFNKQYPHIEIEVLVDNSIHIEQYILDNKVDFALIETEPTLSKIKSIAFMCDVLCTIAHPQNPLCKQKNVSLKKIEETQFLMRERGSSVRELVEGVLMMNQISIKPTWQSISTQALINAVKNNLGITTLPYQLVKKEIENQTVKELNIKQLNIQRRYNIIYYQDKYLSQFIYEFFELCKKYSNQF